MAIKNKKRKKEKVMYPASQFIPGDISHRDETIHCHPCNAGDFNLYSDVYDQIFLSSKKQKLKFEKFIVPFLMARVII